jgi:hypothetical protein
MKGPIAAKRFWRLRIGGVLSAILLTGLVSAPAHAQGGTSAVCTFVFSLNISPGLSLTPTWSTFGTSGENGTVICVGTFNGHQVTGPGSAGVHNDSTVFGTCLSDHGSGKFSMSLPTDAGSVRFEGTFRESSIGPAGEVSGTIPGATFTGVEFFLPTEGDCVLNPATVIAYTAIVSFSS